MKIGEKILYLRKNAGMSQESLGEKMYVSRQTVYKWETDAATPEVEKIRQLARLFGVSFDYLMDDTIDTVDTAEREQKDEKKERPVKFRYVYDSRVRMQYFQADIDHGYSKTNKHRVSDSAEIYAARDRQMKETLKKIGADTTIPLQGDLAGCFFENSAEMFFGFYYGGSIQFLCPFENFISVHLSDSGAEVSYDRHNIPMIGFGQGGIQSVGVASVPQVMLNPASCYTISVFYFDESGKQAEFKIDIHCERLYTIHESKRVQEIEAWKAIQADFARTKLNEINGRMSAYPVMAMRIANGETEPKAINIAAIQEIVREAKKKERQFITKIEDRAAADNRAATKIKLIAFGVIVGILIIILIARGIANAAEERRIDEENRQAAAEVVQLIDKIDTVTLDDRSLLKKIENRYAALTDAQKQYVSNYATYTSSKSQYDVLYREYMDEKTKDDPTRDLVLSDLNGVWECDAFQITIGDFSGGKSVWYYTYNKKTGFSGLGGVSTGTLPSSTLGDYDSLTQTKSGKLYQWSNGLTSEYRDFTVKTNKFGIMTLTVAGYTFTKNEN